MNPQAEPQTGGTEGTMASRTSRRSREPSGVLVDDRREVLVLRGQNAS